VAYIADIHLHVPLGASGFKGVPAGTGNDGLCVFRMNSFFHLSCSLHELKNILSHVFALAVCVKQRLWDSRLWRFQAQQKTLRQSVSAFFP
jgi:hypothetical protein